MRKYALPSLVLSGCIALAGCSPTVAPLQATTVTAIESYLCPTYGEVRLTVGQSQVVFETAAKGLEILTGASPTYYGDEISITLLNFDGNSPRAFLLSEPGAQETCLNNGLG